MIKINNRAKTKWKKKKKKINKVKIYKSIFDIIHSIILIAAICFVNPKALRFIILTSFKALFTDHILLCDIRCPTCTVSNLHWIVISISIACWIKVFHCLERENIREIEEKMEEENLQIWIDFEQIYRP